MNNINKFEITERPECCTDTKLFFDDVYKSGTRGKKQQVDVLQYGRSLLSKCAEYTQYFLSDVYTNSTQTKKAQVETAQYGRSMIEMLGVLAIVGVLSVGGIAGYSKAMEKFKINKTIDQVSTIVANIRTLFAQQTSYGNMYTYEFNSVGVIPEGIYQDGFYRNPLGGVYQINSGEWGGTIFVPEKYFTVSIGGLSKEVCIALASYDWGDIHSTGLLGITIGNQTIDVTYSTSATTNSCKFSGNKLHCPGTGRIPLAQAQQACSAFGEGNITDMYGGAWLNLVYE